MMVIVNGDERIELPHSAMTPKAGRVCPAYGPVHDTAFLRSKPRDTEGMSSGMRCWFGDITSSLFLVLFFSVFLIFDFQH